MNEDAGIEALKNNEALASNKLFNAKIKGFLWGGLLVALVAGGFYAKFWYENLRPPALGNPYAWTTLEAKQRVADTLAEVVQIPGFLVGVHKVESGENYWSIAKEADLDIDSLVGFNPELENLNAWKNQPLLMANQRGALVIAGEGDSFHTLSIRAGLNPLDVAQANKLPWYGMRPGQIIFLPGAKPAMLTAQMKRQYGRRSIFRSPLQGSYSSLEGIRSDPFTGVIRKHNGVDIRAEFNTPVGAAASGKVIFAGWKGGYGKCVIIRHEQGYKSLYGHLNTLLVKSGTKVSQHQFIGKVGATGRATGPHLHFTIWHNGKIQDPLQYLW